MRKTFLILMTTLFLAGCSGHVAPPAVQFGKKCTVGSNDQIVYSYVWFHKKGTQLEANEENCKLIADK